MNTSPTPTEIAKPCPFCGSHADDECDYGEEPNFYIHCSNKDCCIWDCGMPLESWNRRAPALAPFEKLRDELLAEAATWDFPAVRGIYKEIARRLSAVVEEVRGK